VGIFDGVAEASPTRLSNYFKPGHYLWRIERVKEAVTRKGIPYFVAECVCAHVFDDADGKGHRVREEASWLITADKDAFKGNLKSFLMGASGCTEQQISESKPEDLAEVVGDSQPLAGVIVETLNVDFPTRAGGVFTRVGWKRPWEPQEVAEVISPEIGAWLGLEVAEE